MIIESPYIIKNPLVSVVIPSYNRANTVVTALESILHQRCNFDYEIIIGDDCSTDDVRNILLQYQVKYPSNVKLLFHEQNIGLGANWASCVKLCRGKYLAGCDDDDYWHNPDKLQLQVQFLEKNNEFGMVHTDVQIFNTRTGIKTEAINHDAKYNESLIKVIFAGKFKCCNSSAIYRKSVIDKYVKLDDFIYYQFPLQDWPIWICIANFTKFHCLPVVTTTLRIGNESITRSGNFEKMKLRIEKEIIMYKYLTERFPDDLQYDEKGVEDHYCEVLLNKAYCNFNYSEVKDCIRKLNRNISNNYRINMANYRFTFYLYAIAKNLKNKFKNNFIFFMVLGLTHILYL